MNKLVNTSLTKSAPAWERPKTRPDTALTNRTVEDIVEWDQLADEVASIATSNSWSKAEVARRVGMPDGTFSQWFSGTYAGQLKNQNIKVAQWVAALKESASLTANIPQKPPFQRTRIAGEITDTLALAQATGDLVMITVDAGNGKTPAWREYFPDWLVNFIDRIGAGIEKIKSGLQWLSGEEYTDSRINSILDRAAAAPPSMITGDRRPGYGQAGADIVKGMAAQPQRIDNRVDLKFHADVPGKATATVNSTRAAPVTVDGGLAVGRP